MVILQDNIRYVVLTCWFVQQVWQSCQLAEYYGGHVCSVIYYCKHRQAPATIRAVTIINCTVVAACPSESDCEG